MAANAEQERTELLHEIARLEAEIAKVSRSSAADSPHLTSPAGGSHKRPRRAANATEDGDETAGGWRTRLDTVGGAFCTQESGQANFKRNSLLRLHTLSGSLPLQNASISFTVSLHVREPDNALEEAEKNNRDPGREFVVEKMQAEVKGGGAELREGLAALHLDREPNPPAFFTLLRQYSLLSSARAALFSSLRARFPTLTANTMTKNGRATELVFASSSSDAPTLTHTYRLLPSASPTALRLSRTLDPQLSLSAQIPPSLPPAARSALEAIPDQFRKMLDEGFEPEKAVEAVVEAVFGDAGNKGRER
ncbi:hypothetical protein JCM11641_006275 [Rhodosporidiobolus odoratus]